MSGSPNPGSSPELPQGEVTSLLARVKGGDREALNRLLPLVYRELRLIANNCMRGERPGHTLQPTAVVHEAYLRLAGLDHLDWQNRAQFMGVAAQLMRRILINHARDRIAAKRGAGNVARGVELDDVAAVEKPEEVLAVDAAVEKLAELNPEQGRILEMRYFGGMSVEETAEALDISPRTVKRHWALAKAWLRTELSAEGLS
jgi:RNA polymerase sigma factor (TIGR02999 family)